MPALSHACHMLTHFGVFFFFFSTDPEQSVESKGVCVYTSNTERDREGERQVKGCVCV